MKNLARIIQILLGLILVAAFVISIVVTVDAHNALAIIFSPFTIAWFAGLSAISFILYNFRNTKHRKAILMTIIVSNILTILIYTEPGMMHYYSVVSKIIPIIVALVTVLIVIDLVKNKPVSVVK